MPNRKIEGGKKDMKAAIKEWNNKQETTLREKIAQKTRNKPALHDHKHELITGMIWFMQVRVARKIPALEAL